ncbi:MAG TPA: hypothetical protein VJN22_02890 [Candidatus Eremiobacteraceae bacterium]|nr:hypothetical protein [Candidatus Eremiobacteraceae bacterium]
MKHDGQAAVDDPSDSWSHKLREPLPRRRLSPGILALLWILRIYVIVAVPLVIYAFFNGLHQHH